MKAIDVSGKRQNRAMGAVSATEAAARNEARKPPERRKVVSDLDSRVFAHRVGLDPEESNETLLAAKNAYNNYAAALDQLYDGEVTIRADTTRTKEAHDLRVSKMATDSLEPVSRKTQAAYERLNNEIKTIESQIEHDTKARLTPAEQQEIRGYVRTLPDADRRQFLAGADDDTLSAVLAGKAYLSGLSPAEAKTVNHNWRERRFPELNTLKAKCERARELMQTGWERYMVSVSALRDPDANTVEAKMEAADRAAKEPLNLEN